MTKPVRGGLSPLPLTQPLTHAGVGREKLSQVNELERLVADVFALAPLRELSNEDPRLPAGLAAYHRLQSMGYDPQAIRGAADLGAAVRQLRSSGFAQTSEEMRQLTALTQTGANRTRVGVIDGGFDDSHAAWAAQVATNTADIPGNGRDDDNNGVIDDNRVALVDTEGRQADALGRLHGTAVAGLAARGDTRIQVVPIRGLGSDRVNIQRLVAAIEYAAARGSRVVNLSCGTPDWFASRTFRDAFARHPNVLFVVAAGNHGQALGGESTSAQQLPNVIVVGSVDSDANLASSSSRGDYVTLLAPGAAQLVPTPGQNYERLSGTSFAAPRVSSLAARCLLLDPELPPQALARLLYQTSADRSRYVGDSMNGTINETEALRVAAYSGLIRRGLTPVDAAARLSMSALESSARLALVRWLHMH